MTTAWRRYGRAAATAAVVLGASLASYRVANAVSGGETRAVLSWSGRLTGRTGAAPLRFEFRRAGISPCVVDVSATPDTAGHLEVEVPLDGCRGLFDGSDVRYDVSVDGAVLVRDQAVDPVPHARYADRVGVPECPIGYDRATAPGVVLCRRELRSGVFDEVVRVGDGEGAFWIDRFEAGVWSATDTSGTRHGVTGDDYPATFPDDGQWTAAVYARSVEGAGPSRFLTWFQAQEACRASGKRLPTMPEWFLAARGTIDPQASDGSAGACRTSGDTVRAAHGAGESANCVSHWGARDMFGNVSEMVEEWFAQLADSPGTSFGTWPAGFGQDDTANFTGTLIIDSAGTTGTGMPAMVLRGGDASNGGNAGLLCLDATRAPTSTGQLVGFRCVVPR
jgi:formylglycine-generating enzyme required for sulfatase activity